MVWRVFTFFWIRLRNFLRRPWTAAYIAAFAGIAFGWIDLGMGISQLRLDHPSLDRLAAENGVEFWELWLNSAAFWTGLMLAASSALVSGFITYEAQIAPYRTRYGEDEVLEFPSLNRCRILWQFLEVNFWFVAIFSCCWLLFNFAELQTNSCLLYTSDAADE